MLVGVLDIDKDVAPVGVAIGDDSVAASRGSSGKGKSL